MIACAENRGLQAPTCQPGEEVWLHSSDPTGFAILDDRLYFGAAGSIWSYDGDDSLYSVDDRFDLGSQVFGWGSPLLFGENIYFEEWDRGLRAYDGQHAPPLALEYGLLWSPLFVAFDRMWFLVVQPGDPSADSWPPNLLYAWDGVSEPYFVAEDPPTSFDAWCEHDGMIYYVSNDALWEFDGTYPPRRVATVNEWLDYTTGAHACISFDGKLYFTAGDETYGREMWVYDGAHKPSLVADLIEGPEGAWPLAYSVFNGQLYFIAGKDNELDSHLWSYDGATLPKLVTDMPVGLEYTSVQLPVFAGALYFHDVDGYLWRYDGEHEPEQVPVDSESGGPLTVLLDAQEFDGQLYFSGYDTFRGAELWRYDGHGAPQIVADLAPGYDCVEPDEDDEE
jgi:ELWxxDGT repeat protein